MKVTIPGLAPATERVPGKDVAFSISEIIPPPPPPQEVQYSMTPIDTRALAAKVPVPPMVLASISMVPPAPPPPGALLMSVPTKFEPLMSIVPWRVAGCRVLLPGL